MDRVRAAGGGIRSAPHRHRSDQSEPDLLQRQHPGPRRFRRGAAAITAVVGVASPPPLPGGGGFPPPPPRLLQLTRGPPPPPRACNPFLPGRGGAQGPEKA